MLYFNRDRLRIDQLQDAQCDPSTTPATQATIDTVIDSRLVDLVLQ